MSYPISYSLRFRSILWGVALGGALCSSISLHGQTCSLSANRSARIFYEVDYLPIEKSGFYPYVFSAAGSDLPIKYQKETWGGSGMGQSFSCGCSQTFDDVGWSGNWTFSVSNFTDTSTKAISYEGSGCGFPNGPETRTENAIRAGLVADGFVKVHSPGVTSSSATFRDFVNTTPVMPPSSCTSGIFYGVTGVTESLSDVFSLQHAMDRAEASKTPGTSTVQYWNEWYPATNDEAATLLANGTIGRTTPMVAHGEKVRFAVEFDPASCNKEGEYLVTYFYQETGIGNPVERSFTEFTETVTFTEAPYRIPQTGFKDFHIELKNGQSAELVAVTVLNAGACGRLEPGSSGGSNGSVDKVFHLGNSPDGNYVGSVAIKSEVISERLYEPLALQLRAVESPDLVKITENDAIRQVLAAESFVDVVTVDDHTFEIRFYLPSQAGAFDAQTGLYPITGQPYVTHRVENPDATPAGKLLFSEIRGSSVKETLYEFTGDSEDGTMTMSTGNGLRVEELVKDTAGTTITETRTIKDASAATVSVTSEVYEDYPFGQKLVSRVLDPDGAALTTTNVYYDNEVSDGTSYGLLKETYAPSGRWTHFMYDADGRVTETFSQFLNLGSNGGGSSNRKTLHTYDDAPTAPGMTKLVTTVNTLQDQEFSRSYEATFGTEVVDGDTVETRWFIRAAASGAAWDATGNLVTKRRTFIDGPFNGSLVSELRADGTLTTNTYVDDGTHLTTTMLDGAADVTGTSVVSGRRTVLVETLTGRMVSRDVFDYPSNTLLTSEVATIADSFGRPTRIDHLDGTFELRGYDCCGLDMVTDRQGTSTHFHYNDLAQIDRETRAGIAQQRGLDPDGRLLSVTRIGTDDSEIITESHSYDLSGRLISSRDGMSRETTFSEVFDNQGQNISMTTYPDGGTLVRTYASDGSLLSITGDAAPQHLNYEYGVGVDGRFTKEIRLGNSGETTEWVTTYTDFLGRPYKREFADGAVELSYFNDLGQLVRQVDPDGITVLFAYNAEGEQEVSAIDMDGDDVIDYDGTDRITRTTTTVAQRDGFTVERSTTEVWETDSTDLATTVSVVESTPEGRRVWQTERGLLTTAVTTLDGTGGRTATTTAPDGTVTTQTFQDDLLATASVSHPSIGTLGSTTYGYDVHNRLDTVTDARNGATTMTYFADDQLHTVTTPDPDPNQSGEGYDAQTTTYGYDTAGRQNQVTEPDSTIVHTTYWPTGQVKRTWGSRTYPVEYVYDSQSRLQTMTTWQDFAGDTGKAVTTWNYTPDRGFLTNKRYADNQGPSYTYTNAGRLETRVWARGITTTYGYDDAGTLFSTVYSDITPSVTLTYDRIGRQKTRTDAAGTCTWTYDVTGQLADESYSAGMFDGITLDRTFDALARMTDLEISGSYDVDYDYDAASRLETVTHGVNTADYTYHANSPLVDTLTFKNSGTTRLTTAKSYDQLNRVTTVVNTPSADAVQSYSYTYNNANQRTRVDHADGSYWDYGYDALGQVTTGVKRLANGDPALGHDYGYVYDDIGNRTSTTTNALVSTYSPNNLNQYDQRTVPNAIEALGTASSTSQITVNGDLAQRQNETWFHQLMVGNDQYPIWSDLVISGTESGAGPQGGDAVSVETRSVFSPQSPEIYSYDADGNLVQDGQWSYTWNGENRLVEMKTRQDLLPPGGPYPFHENQKLEFIYDGVGRRVAKKVYDWTVNDWSLRTDINFIYDGWNMITELNGQSSNTALRAYVWGLDLSGSLQGAGGVGGLLFTYLVNLTTHSAAFDGNGNVVACVTMGAGTKSASYEYNPFGQTTFRNGPEQEVFRFLYSTKYEDGENKLIYYGFRYYKIDTGRWLNRDPISEFGGLGLYVMVSNSTMNNFDFLGLNCCKSGTILVVRAGFAKLPYNQVFNIDKITSEFEYFADSVDVAADVLSAQGLSSGAFQNLLRRSTEKLSKTISRLTDYFGDSGLSSGEKLGSEGGFGQSGRQVGSRARDISKRNSGIFAYHSVISFRKCETSLFFSNKWSDEIFDDSFRINFGGQTNTIPGGYSKDEMLDEQDALNTLEFHYRKLDREYGGENILEAF